MKERRVEQRVEFVVPRDHRAGETGEEQEGGGAESEPSVQAHQQRSHAGARFAGRQAGANAITIVLTAI
jgi:hypothetical protein